MSEATQQAVFPPVVYVPCEKVSPGDEDVTVELRQMADGRMALLTYSALDRLVNCCGQYQPWVVMPTEKLEEIDKRTPFDVILLDIEIPEEHQRQAED